MELNRPASLRGWRRRNPDVGIQAILILDVGNGRCGVGVVDFGECVVVDWLRTYWSKPSVVSRLIAGVVEREVGWKRLWSSPSKVAYWWKSIRDFGEAVENRLSSQVSLLESFETTIWCLEGVWMICRFCWSHGDYAWILLEFQFLILVVKKHRSRIR